MNVDQATTPAAGETVAETATEDVDLGVVRNETDIDTELGGEAGEGDPDPGEGQDTQTAEAEGDVDEDLEEIEIDGETYKVPPALKAAALRREDYTRKTQELADERRALEAERQSHSQAQTEQVERRAKVLVIDGQLAQIAKTNWEELAEESPGRAIALQQAREELRAAKADLEGEIMAADRKAEEGRKKAGEERTAKETADHQAALAASHAELSKAIKGWSPELAGKMAAFTQTNFGISPKELAKLETDPRMIRLVHAAFAGAEALKTASATRKIEAAQSVRPAATVKGSAPARKTPEQMSTDEWMRHRNKQVATKGR